jgi:hypothetical protein
MFGFMSLKHCLCVVGRKLITRKIQQSFPLPSSSYQPFFRLSVQVLNNNSKSHCHRVLEKEPQFPGHSLGLFDK